VIERGWSLREIFAKVPRGLTKTLFLTTAAYPFTADFLSIFLIASLGSFRALGEFFALRVALEIILNLYIGRRTDLGRVRGIFIASVIFAAGFWMVLPFVHASRALYLLQFTLGLAAIASLIPFETVYHNAAKVSGHPFEFAMWREVLHNAGLIVGCAIALVILAFTPHWQLFIPLGAVSALGLLFIYPYLPGSAPPYDTV